MLPAALRERILYVGFIIIGTFAVVFVTLVVCSFLPAWLVFAAAGLAAMALHWLAYKAIVYLDRSLISRLIGIAVFRLPSLPRALAQWLVVAGFTWISGAIWYGDLSWFWTLPESKSMLTLLDATCGRDCMRPDKVGMVEDLARLAGRMTLSGAVLALAGWRLGALFDPRNQRTYPKLMSLELPRGPSARAGITIAHLSDIHLTAGDFTTESRDADTDDVFERALEQLDRGDPSTDASLSRVDPGRPSEEIDVLLLSGDITDRGKSDQWDSFKRLIEKHERLRSKIIFVHGNHDLNFSSMSGWRQYIDIEPIDQRRRTECRARTLKALVEFMPDVCVLDGMRLVTLREKFGPRISDVSQMLDGPGGAAGEGGATRAFDTHAAEVDYLWTRAFPLIKMVTARGRQIGFILMDSIAPSTTILSNAYGSVHPGSMRRLATISALLNSRGFTPVAVIHHHPAMHHSLWAGSASRQGGSVLEVAKRWWAESVKEPAMIIENADELLDALHEARVRLVFHGHQHHAETGILADSGLKIIGAGSTTLKHGSNPPGFCTFELSPSSRENTLDIRLIERYQFDRALQKFRTS